MSSITPIQANTLLSVRVNNSDKKDNDIKIEKPKNDNVKKASYIGSAIGIFSAVGIALALAKKKNPNINFKTLTYDEKDILMLGGGSILGGLTGGLLADKNKENKIPKYREALQQFFGSLLCPVGVISVAEHLYDKSGFKVPDIKTNSKLLKNAIKAAPKIAVTAVSLVFGMELGNRIMNKINNKLFKKEEKYEVHPSDYLVHADDLCVAINLIFKDTPKIATVASKALPFAFILAGAKTGMQEENK